MSNRLTNIIAIFLLLFVLVGTIFSIKDDSLTMDEVSHLPAGYSYLTQKDMRINPEHPPLIKDLSAIPLLFIKGIKFPFEIKDWNEDINGQWGFGYNFLYKSGNPADKMIFWGRIPMILVLVLLGFYIFRWTRELFGNKVALFSLFLFSFSPSFLAHGRLVTTDVGAAAGVFIATYYFIKALKNPKVKNIVLAGIFFGLAELCKFSVILLIPFFVVLGLIWWLIKSGKLREVIKVLISVFILGFLLIGAVYQYHVWNYPIQRQLRDTQFLLSSQASGPSSIKEACFSKNRLGRCPSEIVIWMSQKPILRAFSYYGLGLLMVFQRASGGHTTYFLGEISAAGWKNYFPVVYLIKESLVFHILTIISLIYLAWLIKKPFWQNIFHRIFNWSKNHFPELSMLIFIGIYWFVSLRSNLNIGVRHLLPTFPFAFILVSRVMICWLKPPILRVKYLILAILIVWQTISVIKIFPHFLSYFNEIAGGPEKAYVYTVNSNLDWGQDLKRLKKWVEQNKIEKIYVDYFGGGEVEYYLKEKYVPWWGNKDPKEFPRNNYLAVSLTFLQGGRGKPAPGFNQPYGYYHWLDRYEPVAKIGYSIFVYHIK